MYTSYRFLVVPAVLFLMSGCAVAPGEDDALGSAVSAALSSNALSSNALSSNALSSNALSSNALSSNALASIQDPSPTGDLSRQLLEYTTGCALKPSQSISFSWTDSQGVVQNETYYGQLGLASEWASGPLTHRASQELVSACLAARTNYFGVTVHISVRGSAPVLQNNTTNAELNAYPYVEGAFWGNLFTSSPQLHACYDPINVAHARSDERVCASGYPNGNGQLLPCGMITLTGSCNYQCDYLDRGGQFYAGCGDNDTGNAITIGLQ